MKSPEFTIGQNVRVVLNDRNKTPHSGSIRRVVWHHKDERYTYYIEENAKNISKRYFAEDIELIPKGE